LALSGTRKDRSPAPSAEVVGWRARTDPVDLQMRAILRALISSFLLSRAIDGLPVDAQAAIRRVDALVSAERLPTAEDCASALSGLADLCERDQQISARIGDAWRFIRESIDSVTRSCSVRQRQSPFRLSDDDQRALSSV
jgi:hypothetical protein